MNEPPTVVDDTDAEDATERETIEVVIVEDAAKLSNHVILASLRAHALVEGNVRYVRVDFNGEGDSGDIGEIDAMSSMEPESYFGYSHAARSPLGPSMEATFGCVDALGNLIKLRDALRDIAEKILERGEIPDWVNNEGGQGHLMFDLATGEVNVLVKTREITYEDHNFEYKLAGF